jgi:hypothetical protein
MAKPDPKKTDLAKLKRLIVEIAQQARRTELHPPELLDMRPNRRMGQSSDQSNCSCCCS